MKAVWQQYVDREQRQRIEYVDVMYVCRCNEQIMTDLSETVWEEEYFMISDQI